MFIKALSLLWILSLILFSDACSPEPPPVAPGGDGGINFAVLRYDSAAVQYRLDSLQNRGLVLQPMFTDVANSRTSIQLLSYAYDTLGDYNNSWLPDTLRAIPDSSYKNFQKKMLIGNTEISREQLYDVLIDSSGKRVSYDYMLFTPVHEQVFSHLVYMFQPIKNGKPALNGGKKQITVPIPPGRDWGQ